MSFNAIRENKILAKISEFTVCISSSEKGFVLSNSVDPYEMLYCLQKYSCLSY